MRQPLPVPSCIPTMSAPLARIAAATWAIVAAQPAGS